MNPILKPDLNLGWSNRNLTSSPMLAGKLYQLTGKAAEAVFASRGEKPYPDMNTYVFVLKAKAGVPYIATEQPLDASKPVTIFAGIFGNPQVFHMGNAGGSQYYLYFAMAKGTEVKGRVIRDMAQALQAEKLATLEAQVQAGRERKNKIIDDIRYNRTLSDAEKAELKVELNRLVIPVEALYTECEAVVAPYLLTKME